MPNASLQDAIKEAYATAPAGKEILETLEIRQTGVQDPIYIVKAKKGITAVDENGDDRIFLPVGFQLSLPPENEEGFRSLSVAIDNIGREVNDFVVTAQSQPVPVEV